MKNSWSQRLLDAAGLPDENIPGQPLVELCGCRRVLVENHGGVVEYGTERIGIRVRYGSVQILGQDLQVCRMMDKQLIITGNIASIHLERGNRP